MLSSPKFGPLSKLEIIYSNSAEVEIISLRGPLFSFQIVKSNYIL